MPPSDLFIPHFMPFDLTLSSQPESNPFSEHALLVTSQARGSPNPDLAHSSEPRVIAQDPALRAPDIASKADQLSRHPFKMLPTAVFEQLSDPNLLSSDGNLGFNLLLGPVQPVQQQQGQRQGQQQRHELDFGERQRDENRVQSLMVSVQQKPVWMGSNTGTTLLLLHTTVCVTLPPNPKRIHVVVVKDASRGTTLLLLHATVGVTLQDMYVLLVAIDTQSLSMQPATLYPMLPAYKGRCHLDHSTIAVAKHESAVIFTKRMHANRVMTA